MKKPLANSVDLSSASFSELQALKEKAETLMRERRDSEIDRLRQKWRQEAAALNMTPEQVLGLERRNPRQHQTSEFRSTLVPGRAYRKGPHPAWLKTLLLEHQAETVPQLVELGVLTATPVDNIDDE